MYLLDSESGNKYSLPKGEVNKATSCSVKCRYIRYQAIDPKNQQRQHQAHMSSILRKKKKDEGEDEVLLGVGDTAPDFELFDHEGTRHKLSDFRGKRVLLSFFRYAS